MGAFGEKLRKQREQRGLALDAISNATKISTRMLRALEDERFDQLPGGVFNKGFVRAYARLIGLDEEEAVTDYLAALRESQIQDQSILPDFRAPAGKPTAVAEPEFRNNDLPGNDLPGNDAGNDGSNDHDKDLRRADRRKQSRRNQNRRDEDRRPKDLSSLPDSTTPPNANPPANRFRQKYPAGGPAQPANAPSAPIPWGKLALALLLVALALAFWNFRHRSQPAAAPHPAASSHQSQSPSPVSAPVSAATSAATSTATSAATSAAMPAATQPSASSLALGPASPAGTLSTGTISPGTTPPTTTGPSTTRPPAPVPASSGAAASTAASTAASPTGSASGPVSGLVSKPAPKAPDPDDNPPVAKRGAHAAAAKSPPTFTLLIRAAETSWVLIMADGKPVARETLIAPAHTSVRASREIVVKAGNAAGISFLLNGREIPAQGNVGEVKTYVFDPTGVRIAPQPQPAAPPPNR